MKPFEVQKSLASTDMFSGQNGFGTQFQPPDGADILIKRGIIVPFYVMTIKELNIKLQELGVSEDRYYLHGLYGSTNDDDKLSLIIRKEGHSVRYEVYFK